MKRFSLKQLLVGSLSSLAILSVFPSCGKEPVACMGDDLTTSAQACADRASLGFAQEFGSGTKIGTAPQETLSIKNGGIADLTITAATFNGDPAFSMTTEPTSLPATVKGNQYFFMRVVFAPTEARAYSGKITLQSNGEKSPSIEFPITGCGVPTDGGTSPCYRDGGM